MYKIEPLTRGRYKNIEPGTRYCLFRKDIRYMYNLFTNDAAEVRVYKFVHMGNLTFGWEDITIDFEMENFYNET